MDIGLSRATRYRAGFGKLPPNSPRLLLTGVPPRIWHDRCLRRVDIIKPGLHRSRMMRLSKNLFRALVLILLIGAGYCVKAVLDARSDAVALAAQADTLIAAGRGPADLGAGRADMLLAVQDPGFADHNGLDFTTPGAGATTVTQSLSKRLAFDEFRPGIGKLRQSAYALGLETRLSKDQIMALFLDSAQMGNGPDGSMTGFFTASEQIFGAPPAQLSDQQFLALVAVLIAPGRFNLRQPGDDLDERIDRISRLIAHRCAPSGHGDVWLEGCAAAPG